MTPERLILLTALCPTPADFTRIGPIVKINVRLKPETANATTGARYDTLTYELRMTLLTMTDLNKRIGQQPAPEPVRGYEIICENTVIKSGTY